MTGSAQNQGHWRMINAIVKHNAKNKTQAAIIATATGCKDIYPLASLPGHNRIEESKPDACHTIKDVTQNIVNLITCRNVNLDKILAKEEAEERLHSIDTASRPSTIPLSPVPTKKRKYRSDEKVYPFILTREELTIADQRAASIRPPLGFGFKPSAFFTKPGSMKSHDWKQVASQGILKFCIRDALSDRCRNALFNFFDCISALCRESQDLEEVEEMEEELNKALASLECDLPLFLQNITTHLLHHIPESIKLYGPVYATWMYVFERFNSWICKRALNMRYPEATAIETFIIYDWCQFMEATNRIPSDSGTVNFDASEILDKMNESCKDSIPVIKEPSGRKMFIPRKRDLNAVHKLCDEKSVCEKKHCSMSKYFVHQLEHPITKQIVTCTCQQKKIQSAKTISSYICSEFDRGRQEHKVSSGKFVLFGRIQYFLRHENQESGKVTSVAYVSWFSDSIFDIFTRLWKASINGETVSSYLHTSHLSVPLVTAVENESIWFLNSGKSPFSVHGCN